MVNARIDIISPKRFTLVLKYVFKNLNCQDQAGLRISHVPYADDIAFNNNSEEKLINVTKWARNEPNQNKNCNSSKNRDENCQPSIEKCIRVYIFDIKFN